jgi:hypothetical protein
LYFKKRFKEEGREYRKDKEVDQPGSKTKDGGFSGWVIDLDGLDEGIFRQRRFEWIA